MTQRDRMLAGEAYEAWDPELVAARLRARELVTRYNASAPADSQGRRALLEQLLGAVGEQVVIEPPFHCDYGSYISLESEVFLNFGCVILDCAPVSVGPKTLLGPKVQLCAATHSLDPRERDTGRELAGPISIGRNVWIGAGAIVAAGVTIGDDSVIGAGSVVVRDVPSGALAAGVPAKVIRELP
jgi:maltose O-acetyltransferase